MDMFIAAATVADFLLTLSGPVQTMLIAEVAQLQAEGLTDEEIIAQLQEGLADFEG